MDVKSLAKSKRAHSIHHSKKHNPHQTSKVPSVSSDNKKPTAKQAKEKPAQSHVVKPLPSNWGRYNENLDSIFEEAQPRPSQLPEFGVPKSRGADYAHLIFEAKDQSRSKYSPDGFTSIDEVINDFTQGFGPMLLAAKGQSIFSWVTDDDFEFEGKTSTNIEAPFLSLNLNALAEQLAKAKLSNRCFLDPDLFPFDLLDDELEASEEEKKHDPQSDDTVAVASSLGHNQDCNKNLQQYHDESSCFHVQNAEGELKHSKQDNFDGSLSRKSNSESVIDSTAKSRSIFQATSAEAELDMLLSSFGETSIIESASASSSRTGIASMADVSGETMENRTHMEITNFDDGIDKLLEETSNLTNIDGRGASSEPGSKSKLLDDFDSWLDTI